MPTLLHQKILAQEDIQRDTVYSSASLSSVSQASSLPPQRPSSRSTFDNIELQRFVELMLLGRFTDSRPQDPGGGEAVLPALQTSQTTGDRRRILPAPAEGI